MFIKFGRKKINNNREISKKVPVTKRKTSTKKTGTSA